MTVLHVPVFKAWCLILKLPIYLQEKETSLTRFIKNANDRLILIASGTLLKKKKEKKCNVVFILEKTQNVNPSILLNLMNVFQKYNLLI